MKTIVKQIAVGSLLILSQGIFALDLEVEILNRKSPNSKINCGVYETEAGFPSDSDKRLVGDVGKTENGKTVCKFTGLLKKSYAVAVMEDLNGNGKMDSTLVGFPKEPWGVSNDAPMQTFGPPKFQEALFSLTENKKITIRLNQPN